MNTTSIHDSMSFDKNYNYFNYPVVSPPLTPVISPSAIARQSRKSKSQKNTTDSNNHKHVCQFDFCGWSFKRYEHLKRHMLVHTGERPYQCQFLNCGKSFSRSDNFHAHYRTHTKIKNCATYAKRKSAAATPVSAAVTHTSVTDGHYPYIANQQNQTLIPPNSSLASSVATTAAAVAVSQSQQVFYDGYLYDNRPTVSLELDPNFLHNIYTSPPETILSSPFSLYNDEPVVQNTSFDPFFPSCMPQTMYVSNHTYVPVSPVANPTQPYSTKSHTCPLLTCSRQFKRLEHLKRHMRVHTLERPFSCSFPGCHKQFSRSDNLSQHYKTHSERNLKM